MQCLRKEQSERYASAQDLADDLGSFLKGEPVRARPISSVERLWRWSKRNRGMAALLAAVFILRTTLAVTSTVFAILLNAETEAKKAERKQAIQNEATALAIMNEAIELVRTQVTDFYTSLRDTPNIPQSMRDDLMAKSHRELDSLMTIAAERFAASPEVETRTRAGILQRAGDIVLAAGRIQEAEEQFRASHA